MGDPGSQKGLSSYASHPRTPTARSVQQTRQLHHAVLRKAFARDVVVMPSTAESRANANVSSLQPTNRPSSSLKEWQLIEHLWPILDPLTRVFVPPSA